MRFEPSKNYYRFLLQKALRRWINICISPIPVHASDDSL